MDIETLNTFAQGIARYCSMLYQEQSSVEELQKFRDAMSSGQLNSKIRLLRLFRDLKLSSNNALFIGHWHGLLPYWLLSSRQIRRAVGIEIDPRAVEISQSVCRDLPWSSQVLDAENLTAHFFQEMPIDLVINTSCEHMTPSWLKALPEKTQVVAQSNNLQIPEHINPHESLESFRASLNLRRVLYEDAVTYDIYTRFTVIGEK